MASAPTPAALAAAAGKTGNSAPACDTPVLATSAGPVCGLLQDSGHGRQAKAFLGMPFAESTAGARRWTPPVAVPRWNETLRATRFGPARPQYVTQASAKLLAAHNI